jgi:hypothetical protein
MPQNRYLRFVIELSPLAILNTSTLSTQQLAMRTYLYCLIASQLLFVSHSMGQEANDPYQRNRGSVVDVDASRHIRVAQFGLVPAPSAPVVQSEAANSSANDPKLLSTASMIGPMRDASSTFSRLQIQDDWRAEEQIIPTGPRVNQESVIWSSMAYTWTSPVFSHRPLYFEQPNLERYGNGPRRIFQPALSSAHFFISAPLVPVKMLYNAPWSDIYTLGEGRPGNLVPWQTHSLIEE